MKEFLYIIGLIVLCFVGTNLAQQTPAEKLFEVKGNVKNQDKVSLAGLVLTFEGKELNKAIVSDENGAFAIKLPVGKYKVTANAAVSKNFVAFIETFDNNLNATDFDLIIETEKFCCSQMLNGNATEVVKYFAPPYPPAAKAVRAMGEVVVAVKIDNEGKVISAKTESGHPLLRVASEQAAKQWIFPSDENGTEREGKIVFAFIDSGKESPTNQFIKPNRLVVLAKPNPIDTTASY